ncbi:MAG: lipopolysaccharide biosynthesis protein, partial [Mesorhizobium sp.]
VRAINLGLLAGLKAVLLTYVLTTIPDTPDLVLSLNIVFLLLYLASMFLTYSAMRRPAKAI